MDKESVAWVLFGFCVDVASTIVTLIAIKYIFNL